MISAVFQTENDEVSLAHALRSLVPAATEGVVRDVIVVDRGSIDGTCVVAETAGCEIVRARGPMGADLKRAVDEARAEWLLFLSPEAILDPEWKADAYDFIGRMMEEGAASRSAAVFRLSFSEGSFGSWFIEKGAFLRTRLFCAPHPEQGLLISKAFYRALGGHSGEALVELDFVRRIGRRRLHLLRTPVRLRHPREWRSASRALRKTAALVLLVLRVPARMVARVAG